MNGRPKIPSIIASLALLALVCTPSLAAAEQPSDEPTIDIVEPATPSVPDPTIGVPTEPTPDIDPRPEATPRASEDAPPTPASPTSTSSDPAPTATPTEVTATDEVEPIDRKSGEHLRPPGEAQLVGKHPVALGSATYKPGTGLTFESEDGRFALATRLRAQFRYTFEHDAGDGPSHGLQIRRARLQFKGHVFNEHNRFKTEFALSPRDMGFDGTVTHRTPILDWYFDFTYLRDLTVRIGQYKVPYSRQRVVSSGDLQMVDRSIANGEFNLDRDIGLDIRSKDFLGLDKLRYYAGVYFGEGRDQFDSSSFEMFYLARVEVLPFGMFNDYKEADFERSLRPRLSLGAAYAFVDGAVGNKGIRGKVPTDGGTTDYHNVTADMMFKFGGFSLFSDVFYRQGQRDFGDAVVIEEDGSEAAAPREDPRNGIGWSSTAGYLIPRVPFEIAARYSQVGSLGSSSSLSRKDEAGGGLSYYFAGHPLKLQLDYFALSPEGAAFRAEDTGHTVRLQLQAAF